MMTKAVKTTAARRAKPVGLFELNGAIDYTGTAAAFENITAEGLHEQAEDALSWAKSEARVLRDEAVW